MNKKLTVVITTYNRKEPLLEQLRSLECQGHFDDYNIVVSDNHSDYNVKQWLKDSLSPAFFDIIDVISRPYNIGGDSNITFSFQIPTSDWMWLLSDDDITEPNSVETVLTDIKRHDDDNICWIKYSIAGPYKAYDNVVIDSISDFFHIFSKGHSPGEMVFMSNNVYRLDHLRPYFADVCAYNDTCMSQVLLPLLAVKNDGRAIELRSESLTNYVLGRISYSLIYAYIRFGNLIYVKNLPLEKEEIKAFKKMTFFSPRQLVITLASVEPSCLRWEYFKKIFVAHYKLISFKSLLLYIYFIVMTLIGARRFLYCRERLLARRRKI